MFRKSRIVAAWSIFALLGLNPAWAQLPSDITQATRPLSAQQRSTVDSFATGHLKTMQGADPAKANESRQALLAPLTSGSRAFRLGYSEIIAPSLSDIARDEDVTIASRLAAVSILGSLASDRSLEELLKTLASDDPALRYASAWAIKKAMSRAAAADNLYMNLGQTQTDLSRRLTERAALEDDFEVSRAIIDAASAMPTAAAAIDAVSESIIAQLVALGTDFQPNRLGALRLGIEKMQKRYVVDLFGTPGVANHERLMVQAAAGTLYLIANRGNGQELADADKELLTSTARAAENLLNLLTRQDNAQTHVTNAVQQGRFTEAASAMQTFWLSGQGAIYGHGQWRIKPGSIEALVEG